MSNKTQVVMAVVAQFAKESVRRKPATIGDPLTVYCEPRIQSVPLPTVENFSWKNGSEKMPLDRRVQLDDSGEYAYIRPISVYNVSTIRASEKCSIIANRAVHRES